MQANIRVEAYPTVAFFRVDTPIFVGTTAQEIPGRPFSWEDHIGTKIDTLEFRALEGDSGTLVFDHPLRRTTTSKAFYQFWWDDDGKLQVHEGLKRLIRPGVVSEERGLVAIDLSHTGGKYYQTHTTGCNDHHVVRVVDLLRYLEMKIDLEELQKRIVK